MSDEILCSINGAEDICDFHLQREIYFSNEQIVFNIFFCLQLIIAVNLTCGQKGNIVYPHWQVIGHPLQLLDTLAQGTLCRGEKSFRRSIAVCCYILHSLPSHVTTLTTPLQQTQQHDVAF